MAQKNGINAQYNVAKADSVPVRVATWQRRRMFDRFLARFTLPNPVRSLLDIGVTSDRSYEASNYLEAWYPYKDRVTAAGIDNAKFLETLYPGMRFVEADACNMPFGDGAFDIVHASAVIEHVGSADRQRRMIAECARVGRQGFFITTPNRWFPIEFHTVLPLVHWLPKRQFRALMRATGRAFFAEESNLNLMTAADLLRLGQQACGESHVVSLETEALLGWPANLLLIGKRRD